MEETCSVWRTIRARFDDDGLLVMKWAFYYHSSGCSMDQLLLARPGVCWQHILTSTDDAPLFRHLYNPVTALSIDSETCFTFLFVLNEQQCQPERETSETEVSNVRTLPQGYPCTQFFSSPQPTLFSPWINTASHQFTVCHYLLIAEHTNLASLRRVTKENLGSRVFGMSLILAAVMPGT